MGQANIGFGVARQGTSMIQRMGTQGSGLGELSYGLSQLGVLNPSVLDGISGDTEAITHVLNMEIKK